jgi:hypothetical protein
VVAVGDGEVMARSGRHPTRSSTTRIASRMHHDIERRTRGCWHGSSPKRGHGGGANSMSGDGDGVPAVPRATLGYGGAL